MALSFHPVRFIEEVKARPGLYNPEHPMDRIERLELWKDVGAVLYPDWHSFSKATAYDRVLQMQKKWRSYRDAYNRELRTRVKDPSRSRKVYRYFKRMSFLGGFEGELSPNEDTDEEDHKLLYPQERPFQCREENTVAEEEQPETTKKSKKRKLKRESSASIEDATPEEYEMPMQMFSTEMTESECDSDRLFLMSFAPEMRELPVHIKMWARAQIANVMQEAVSCHYDNTVPRSMAETTVKRQRQDISSE